jgi:hypothetical protein
MLLIGLLDLLELGTKGAIWANFVFVFLGFIIFILGFVLISLIFLDFRLFSSKDRFS